MSEYNAPSTRYDEMDYRRCGNSGLLLPAVSLGMWHNFGQSDCFDTMRQMCRTAFNHGITHFDLANNYGFPAIGSAEENMGKLLASDFAPYRNELVISTKAGYRMWAGPYGEWGSRKYLLSSLDDSLKRLQLDYVDIFYHHRPDPNTPLEETVGALEQAVRSGKALYVGLSNYDGETMAKAAAMLKERHCPFVINQNSYSIFNRTVEHNGLLAESERQGTGVIIYSPLAQGLLTGRYLHGIPADSRAKKSGIFLTEAQITPERVAQIEQLNQLAGERGQTLAQMALSWVLSDSRVTSVLIGASSPQQIVENIGVLQSAGFSAEERALIDEISGAD